MKIDDHLFPVVGSSTWNDELIDVIEHNVAECVSCTVQTVIDGDQLTVVPHSVDGDFRKLPTDSGRYAELDVMIEDGTD